VSTYRVVCATREGVVAGAIPHFSPAGVFFGRVPVSDSVPTFCGAPGRVPALLIDVQIGRSEASFGPAF